MLHIAARLRSVTSILLLSSLAVGCGSGDTTGTLSASGSGASAGSGAAGFGGSAGASAGAAGISGTGGASAGAGNLPAYVEPVETIDLNELPSDVPTVSLEVDPGAIDTLEADPFEAADVTGTFIDGSGTRFEGVSINFRGAYRLQNLIRSGNPQRNWKVKFSKERMYRSRREWNLNYEPHLRQKLTYDLMKFAGVRCAEARHVLLLVNGEPHGLYLEYEDPDSKDFLEDRFGDRSGDLYKAATDLPGQTPYFATTEYLGDLDEDYFFHWQKKTNNDLLPDDYSKLRAFLGALNGTADADMEGFLSANFDVEKFIRFLAVGNFVSHWDGLPQRPKNYWLYNVPAAGRWVFIPWDLDATFEVETYGLNPMGTGASVFYQLDAHQGYQMSRGEGTERPLVRRMLKIPAIRARYVQNYQAALGSYLNESYLLSRIDALESLLEEHASSGDRETLSESSDTMRNFVSERFERVSEELSGL
jgi:spore coat protein CotH